MHSMILQLAKHHGVQLSDRIAIDPQDGLPNFFDASYAVFNGKDIATRLQDWKSTFDSEDNLIAERPTTIKNQKDHSLLHEIAHYVVAKEEQRSLPEYGLGTVIYGEQLGETFDSDIKTIPAVVDTYEGRIQEYMAQLLCVLWGKEYGISPKLAGFDSSWDQYLISKFNDACQFTYRSQIDTRYDGIPCMWEAMFRLEEMGFWKHSE